MLAIALTAVALLGLVAGGSLFVVGVLLQIVKQLTEARAEIRERDYVMSRAKSLDEAIGAKLSLDAAREDAPLEQPPAAEDPKLQDGTEIELLHGSYP